MVTRKSCFHVGHSIARFADEYSKLSAELPQFFNLLYVITLKNHSKENGILWCLHLRDTVAHFTDITASSLFGQMGTTGYFGSWVQLQKNMMTHSLFTILHKERIVLNLFEYVQSELNEIKKWKQVFSDNLHIHISEFPSLSGLSVRDKQGDPPFG